MTLILFMALTPLSVIASEEKLFMNCALEAEVAMQVIDSKDNDEPLVELITGWQDSLSVLQKILLLWGAIIITVGIFWPYVSRLPFGRLPLDISIKLENTQVYLPIVSCILLSVVLTILLRLLR